MQEHSNSTYAEQGVHHEHFPTASYFQYRCRTIISNSKGITNLSHRDHLHKISNGNNDKSALPNASIETDITKRSSSLILDSKADNALSNPMYDRI
jgi:IMP cyclohydrolase